MALPLEYGSLESIHALQRDLTITYQTLRRPGIGGRTSLDIKFRDGEFGRDQLAASEHQIETDPSLAHDVLITLLSRTGNNRYNLQNGKQPGSIFHEARGLTIDGSPVSYYSMKILRDQSKEFDGNEDSSSQYNTFDAPPHLLRLLNRYCNLYGRDILTEPLRGQLSHLTVEQGAYRVTTWLERNLNNRNHGFLEYSLFDTPGVYNPVRADGQNSYVYQNEQGKAEIPNPYGARSSVELLGYTADALIAADALFGNNFRPDGRESWRDFLPPLQAALKNHFWLEGVKKLAMGTYRTPRGRLTPLPTVSSLPGLTLDSQLYDGLDPEEYLKYVIPTMETLFEPGIATDIGPRFTHKKYADLLKSEGGKPLAGYWNSLTVWPVNLEMALGLDRKGAHGLAEQLWIQLINSRLISGEDHELRYVYPDDTVVYNPLKVEQTIERGCDDVLIATNHPESPQLWSNTVAQLAIDRMLNPEKYVAKFAPEYLALPDTVRAGIKRTERRILDGINRSHLLSEAEALRLRNDQPRVVIDENQGKLVEDALHQKLLSQISYFK